MAKFSEYMPHSRKPDWLNRQNDAALDDTEDYDAPSIDLMDDETGADLIAVVAPSFKRPLPAAAEAGNESAAPVELDRTGLELTEPNPGANHEQTITEDEIVAQAVTADTPDTTADAEPSIIVEPDAESRQYADTVWEEALHSLPAPQRPLQRLLPMTARIGVLGLVAVAMWWTWPRDNDPNIWVNDVRAGDVESLAVVNPANVQASGLAVLAATATPQATSQTTQFTNIVIVTPTSVDGTAPASTPAATGMDGEPIVLEASGLVTDSGDGSIIIEIPDAVAVEALVPPLEAETAAAQQADNQEPDSQDPGNQDDAILIPTATPSPTAQLVAVSSNNIPKVEIVPAVGFRSTTTAEPPTPTSTPTEMPTPTPPPAGPGRLWSTFVPLPATEVDHFWFGDPFDGIDANRFSSPSYQFGSTANNRYRVHHGLDFSNPSGTPVKAAVEGTVVHAGLDDPEVLGPYPNFYGNAVVIRLDQQLPVAGGKLDVFLLYGHLSEVKTKVGEHVKPSDIVGLVGMTGIAIGPHLHVEARLGADTYDHSVNPYLWLKPADGNGAVAVRVLTANGRTWGGAKVSIAQFEGGRAVWGRQIDTYLDTENIGPDPIWGENGAMGDVPAGSYYLIANINGESLRSEFTVTAGQTTFVEIRTEQ